MFKNESMTTELHHHINQGKVIRNINQDPTNKIIKTKMNKKSVRIIPMKTKNNMAISSSKTIVVMVEINVKKITMKINNLTNKSQRLIKQIKVDNKINNLYLCPKNNRTIRIPGIKIKPTKWVDRIVITNINSNTMKTELDLLDKIINKTNKTIKKQSNLTIIAKNMSL